MTQNLADLIRQESRADTPAGYVGWDWFQMSRAEEEVFEINPGRVPLMVAAWGAYEAFMDRVSGSVWDMKHQPALDAAKAERPDIAAAEDQSAWAEFAAAYAGLTNREAWQWYAKNVAWQLRAGVLTFKDGR